MLLSVHFPYPAAGLPEWVRTALYNPIPGPIVLVGSKVCRGVMKAIKNQGLFGAILIGFQATGRVLMQSALVNQSLNWIT